MFITVFLLRIELQVKYSIRLVLHYVLYVHYIPYNMYNSKYNSIKISLLYSY